MSTRSHRANPLLLEWLDEGSYQEARLCAFEAGDGVRFTLSHQPTCYRRGKYRLLVEVAEGPSHLKWGCFDDQDQPMRYYHDEGNAKREADAIAKVLLADRAKSS